MATVVENTIVYDSGVNIIGCGSNEFVHETNTSAHEVDDREDKMNLFRAMLRKQSEKDKTEQASLLTTYKLSEIQEPVGIDDHLPVPNLETTFGFVSASDVFSDMMLCGKGKTENEVYQEKMETLEKEKKEILDQASTILNEPVSDSGPEAYDESADSVESFDTVPQANSRNSNWEWFSPKSECTRTNNRSFAPVAQFPDNALDQSAQKYKGIKVFQSKDDYGRTFFMLDDGIRQHLMIVVFEVQENPMVSVNDVVMNLDYFLSMSQAMEDKEDKTGRPIVRLRLGHELLEIPDTSVAMIMMALTILDRHQKGQKINTENDTKERENSWSGFFEWSVIAVLAGALFLQKMLSKDCGAV